MSIRRALIDSNVWRYLVDADAVEDLRRAARRSGVTIVASPAVLYESLRTSDADVRRRVVKAITRREWDRPMPEVYSECEAVVTEIRRVRPEWIRPRPDLREFHKARADWLARGIWNRARSDPADAARVLAEVEGEIIADARADQIAMRRNMREQGDIRHDLRTVRCRTDPIPGYSGESIECWRFQSHAVYTAALFDSRFDQVVPSAHVDWIGPFVDLEMAQRDVRSWNRFWLYDTDIAHLPREWIRWALKQVQSLRRASPGGPVDNQIGGYLLDCDWVVTADRVFGDCLNQVRTESPFTFAIVKLVPGVAHEAARETIAHVEANSS